MKRMFSLAHCAAMWLLLGSTSQAAELTFSRHYSDHMVLQRDKPALVRGFADKGAEVTVSFAGQSKKAQADDSGAWSVTLNALPANAKGSELVASSGGKKVKLTDVQVGDVILFARQTTIDISLGRDKKGRQAAEDVPSVRVLSVKTIPAYEPQENLAEDAASGWEPLTKEAALKMDAAAFYMARDLAADTDVPIGVIALNLGRHFPIGWMSKEALMETTQIFGEKAKQVGSVMGTMEKNRVYSEDPDHPKNKQRGYPRAPAKEDARYPAAGYNAALHPMRGLALKALLLQLGNNYPYYDYAKIERDGNMGKWSFTGQAYEDCYDVRKWCLYLAPTTAPRLPVEFRKVLGDNALPVGWITPPGSELDTLGRHHYEMRELQREAAEKLEGVDLILPGTDSIALSAQPADAELLGARCLSWLKGAVYKQQGAAPTGPVFERAEMNGSTAQIFFKAGTAKGLKATGGALDHFEVTAANAVKDVAGNVVEKLEYSTAKATIDGETIRLSSDAVEDIAYIRYNWREKPDQGLTGESGLPALPFNTDIHDFPKRIIASGEEKLPRQFFMSIADWENDGPVIYDGQLQTGRDKGRVLGPTGLKVTLAYNRNLFVNNTYVGSPAEGKLLHGDFLYGVNGEKFGDDVFADVAEAITLAETEEANGIMSFLVLRNNRKLTVDIQLEVLGTFSDTSPYNCPKTEKLVEKIEATLAKSGGTSPGKGRTGGHPVFVNPEAMFLLAAGSPEYQGLVRRHVYKRLSLRNLENPVPSAPLTGEDRKKLGKDAPRGHGGPWDLSADILLVSEYYLASGDRNVLPYLAHMCDALTSIQIREYGAEGPWPEVQMGQTGGWRHNFYGGSHYGTMPAIGVPAVLGYHLTKEAGVEYKFEGHDRAVGWFMHNGARIGSIGYGYSAKPRTQRQKPLDPEKVASGRLGAGNGAMGGAAILFDLMGDEKISRVNSHVATHCFNNTGYAHGGHYWLNLYTPLGAKIDGEKSFQKFMKGNRNYQTIHRMHNYSREQGAGFGFGQYLAWVAPRQRLRITGAHESVFAADPPSALKEALESYYSRDYAACEKAADAVIGRKKLNGLDLQKAVQLRDAAKLIQKSIAHDVEKLKTLIAEKRPYEASLDLAQLEAVMPKGSSELDAINAALNQPEMKNLMGDDKKRYEADISSVLLKLPEPAEESVTEGAQWRELVSQDSSKRGWPVKANNPLPEPTAWRMKIVESLSVAPEGWTTTEFDDSAWNEVHLPLNWRENHTSLLRAPFDITDPAAVAALRFNQHAKHMDGMQVYINGQKVALISEVSGGRVVNIPLNDHALKSLKKGRNVLAVTYRHHLRWGSYFRGAGSASGGGLNVTLEMQGK